MSKLGVALLGTGAVAPVHVNGFAVLPNDCEIRALVDLNQEGAQKLKDSMNLTAADIYEDYKEVLARTDIDAVVICLPPKVHCAVAVAALKAGKHVLIEKPMASSLEECDLILEAAQKAGKLVSVVSNNRYKAPTMKVKQMLDEQAAGKLLFTTVNSLWWRGVSYHDIWWRGTWQSEGGGCLMSHAVHHIDLMQWMIGMPEKVKATVGNVGHYNAEVEDFAIATLHYPGMMANLNAGIVFHGELQELVFQTEEARISIPWEPKASLAHPNGFPYENPDLVEKLNKRYEEIPELEHEGHTGQIVNFIRAILGQEELLITGKDGRNTIELIMAMYKSSVEERSVALPIAKDDAFYTFDGMVASMPKFFEKIRSVDKFPDAPPISFGRDVGK